jgi:hypothetical protein
MKLDRRLNVVDEQMLHPEPRALWTNLTHLGEGAPACRAAPQADANGP